MRSLACVAAMILAIGGCGGPAAAGPTPAPEQTYGEISVTFVRPGSSPAVSPTIPVGSEVTIRGSAFDPAVLQVPLGATVTWTNRDAVAHTVTTGTFGAPDGKWDGELSGSGTYSLAFTRPGTYPYYCRYHGGMQATLVVK